MVVKDLRATVVGCLMGIFGFGEEGELVEKVLFPKDAKEIAERLEKIEGGKIIDEIIILVNKMKNKGYGTFIFENTNIAKIVRENLGVEVDVESLSKAGESLRGNMGRFAVETGFVTDAMEINQWIHKVSMELTKLRVKGEIENRDLLVAQTIQTIDEVEKTLNLFMSRVREWYGLHFPELSRLVEKHETYAKLASDLGDRSNFTIENIEKEDLRKSKAEEIFKAAEASIGAKLYDSDMDQIQTICRYILQLYDLRFSLQKYVDELMMDVAPNVSALAGATLGARLIALAGGLNNLAKMPASTIQVLGAEKALFRSLKTGTRPPKHGILFQHTLVHDAGRWLRGKIARALAGKIAIAARTDAFSGRYIGEGLRGDVERRVQEIKEKYPKPKIPAKSKEKSKRKHRESRRFGRKG